MGGWKGNHLLHRVVNVSANALDRMGKGEGDCLGANLNAEDPSAKNLGNSWIFLA
jgi:hypothetical protein